MSDNAQLLCAVCKRRKRVGLFYKKKHTRRGYSQECKSCHKKGPQYARKMDAYYRKAYGISLREYEKMLNEQEGRCFICLRKPGVRRLAVDHDHLAEAKVGTRKSIRGLLCSDCNEFLGKIKDDATAGKRMTEYLTRPLWAERRKGLL